jgi:hypothetical protein
VTKPLFDVFRSALMDNATGSRKEAQDDFVQRMSADPAYLELLATDYFERMSAVWTVRTEGDASKAFIRTDASQDKVERMSHPRAVVRPVLVRRTKEEAAARTATVFAEMKASIRDIVLLDLLLPNGKALRDATGAECAKAGGFFTEVSKVLKPTQVVDRQLTESDLHNIRARFFLANAAA